MSEEHRIESWFNASSDHLYELEIPKNFNNKLRKRILLFRDKCLSWGHGLGCDGYPYGKPSKESLTWALKEAKEILIIIDKSLGIKSEKGQWE